MPQLTPSQFTGIFVSYRREDSSGHAGRLSDKLVEHFGKDRIFMDIDTIEPGEDFVTVIENAVSSCEILIAIIGRNWLSRPGETARRLDNPNDFVRLEIATALSRNIRVIPVLVQRATMPDAQDLPEDLSKLARRNALELSDQRWHLEIEQLISVMERILAKREETLQLAEAARQAEEERRRQEADDKRRAEEETQRRLADEEATRRAAEEKRREQEQRKLREAKEKRLAEEATQKRMAEEELAAEAEAHRLAEQEDRQEAGLEREKQTRVEEGSISCEDETDSDRQQTLQASPAEKQTKPDLRGISSTPISRPPAHSSHSNAGDDLNDPTPRREARSKRTLLLVISASVVVLAVVALISMTQTPEREQQSANLNAPPASTQQTGEWTTVPKLEATALENASRGDDFYKQKKYAEAEPYYREAVRLEPGNAEYDNKLGDVFFFEEKYSEAESQYREAIRLQSGDAVYTNNLGHALLQQKKYADAEPYFREAVRLSPISAYYRSLGDILYFEEKYGEAESQYREAIRLEPENAEYANNLGAALREQEKYADAQQYCQKAVQLKPGSAVYNNDLGVVLYRQKKYSQAQSQFREALRLDPGNIQYQENLKSIP